MRKRLRGPSGPCSPSPESARPTSSGRTAGGSRCRSRRTASGTIRGGRRRGRIRCGVSVLKKRSTRFSHEELVGTKSEVEVDSLRALGPLPDLAVLVGRVVVQDDVDLPPLRHLLLDLAEEPEELLVPVPPVGLADHLARRHVHRGKGRRGPVALVVVGHRPATARLQRQSRLRPVERLDRALLAKLNTTALSGGSRYSATTSCSFSSKRGSVLTLKVAPQMGRQPRRAPHRVHEAVCRAHRPRHRPARPVRRVRGPLLRRPADDLRPQRRLRLRAPAPVVATPGTLLLGPPP